MIDVLDSGVKILSLSSSKRYCKWVGVGFGGGGGDLQNVAGTLNPVSD